MHISNEPPTPEEFVALRAEAGMHPRKVTSAQRGIPNTLFWITLRQSGTLIGMGRVVGDGATVVQITDVAVHPDHQGKGYGKLILEQIQNYIRTQVPDDAFVCLFAYDSCLPFYTKSGFISCSECIGLFWPCRKITRST